MIVGRSLGWDVGDFAWSIMAASHFASGDDGSPRLTPGQLSASRAEVRASHLIQNHADTFIPTVTLWHLGHVPSSPTCN